MKKSITSHIKRQPKVFRSLSGITVDNFNKIYKELLLIYSKSEKKNSAPKNENVI